MCAQHSLSPRSRFQSPRDASADPIADGHVGDHGVDAAGAGEHAGVSDVEALGAPDLAGRIDDPFVLAGRHAARSHLMGGAEDGLGWIQALVLDLGEPGLEVGVIDPLEIARLVLGALGFGFPHKGASVDCTDE